MRVDARPVDDPTTADRPAEGRPPRRRWTALVLLGLASAAAVAGLAACQPIVPTDCTTDWVAGGPGDWADPGNWSGGTTPGPADVVCAPAGSTITLDSDATVAGVALDGTLTVTDGSLTLTRRDRTSRFGELEVTGGRVGGTTLVDAGTLTWTGGTIDGETILVAHSASISGTTTLGGARELLVSGPTSLAGTLRLCDTASVRNLSSLSVTDATISGAACSVASAVPITNGETGALTLGGDVVTTAAIVNTGSVSVAAGGDAAVGGLVQSAGTTTVGDGAFLRSAATLDLTAGQLTGTGTIDASVTGSATVAPGAGAGVLTIDGDYEPTIGSTLALEIAGPSAGGAHDQLVVTGTGDVRGAALTVSVTTADPPAIGDTFTVVTATPLVGPPASVSLPDANTYVVEDATSLSIQVATCDPNVFFPGADLAFADLAGADLHQCDLAGADLSDANLADAILDGADLSGAILSGTNLEGASLRGATLDGTELSYAGLFDADFTDADLTNAWITNPMAQPTGQGFIIWDNTTCPNGLNSDTLGSTGCDGTFTVEDGLLLATDPRATAIG